MFTLNQGAHSLYLVCESWHRRDCVKTLHWGGPLKKNENPLGLFLGQWRWSSLALPLARACVGEFLGPSSLVLSVLVGAWTHCSPATMVWTTYERTHNSPPSHLPSVCCTCDQNSSLDISSKTAHDSSTTRVQMLACWNRIANHTLIQRNATVLFSTDKAGVIQ